MSRKEKIKTILITLGYMLITFSYPIVMFILFINDACVDRAIFSIGATLTIVVVYLVFDKALGKLRHKSSEFNYDDKERLKIAIIVRTAFQIVAFEILYTIVVFVISRQIWSYIVFSVISVLAVACLVLAHKKGNYCKVTKVITVCIAIMISFMEIAIVCNF